MCQSGFDGYENPAGVPDNLLLSTSHAVRVFVSHLATLPLAWESELTHWVAEVFDYLTNNVTLARQIQQLQEHHFAQLSGSYPEPVVSAFVTAIGELSQAIADELEQIGAWDCNHVLWFRFDQLLGYDVVLRKVTHEECWQHCTQEPLECEGPPGV